ncbi:hypothetical protein MTO96_029162 [Rhipicephalus appendiculatus]
MTTKLGREMLSKGLKNETPRCLHAFLSESLYSSSIRFLVVAWIAPSHLEARNPTPSASVLSSGVHSDDFVVVDRRRGVISQSPSKMLPAPVFLSAIPV